MSYNNPSYPPPASNKLPLLFLPQTYQAPSLTIRYLNPSPSPKSNLHSIPTPPHSTPPSGTLCIHQIHHLDPPSIVELSSRNIPHQPKYLISLCAKKSIYRISKQIQFLS